MFGPARSFVLVLCSLVAAGCLDWQPPCEGPQCLEDSGSPDPSTCADGLVTGLEGCDDGNLLGGDGCGSTCAVEPQFACSGEPSACAPICGDNVKLPAEECDDGNASSGDGCSATCTREFVPSHVALSAYKPEAPDLQDVTGINTTTMIIQKGAVQAEGLSFVADANNRAVLSVGKWTVNKPMIVRGDRPLVVVAAKEIVVQGLMDGSAYGVIPGPGGGAATVVRSGDGGNGFQGGGGTSSGGGGAGFGTKGGTGGTTSEPLFGGPEGSVYGLNLTDFQGGSKGGNAGVSFCSGSFGRNGKGGAGGGAIQLSSAVSVTIEVAGGITVSGGGGEGGCSGGYAGGGGGSGGLIFLEAPAVTVAGWLTANGGAGGSGSISNANSNYGADGARNSAVPALGGGAPSGEGNPGKGGNGGTLTAPPENGGPGSSAGGGGGAVGRIWVRTRGNNALVDPAKFSPPLQTDTTF